MSDAMESGEYGPAPTGAMKKRRKKKTAESCPCASSCPMKAIACPETGWEDCGEDAAIKARASKLRRTKDGRSVSARSKTGDPACSAAMSQWKRSGMTSAIAAVLGRCRSKARMAKEGQSWRNAGNESRAQALESRAARGLTLGERAARAKELRAKRATPSKLNDGERDDLRRIASAYRGRAEVYSGAHRLDRQFGGGGRYRDEVRGKRSGPASIASEAKEAKEASAYMRSQGMRPADVFREAAGANKPMIGPGQSRPVGPRPDAARAREIIARVRGQAPAPVAPVRPSVAEQVARRKAANSPPETRKEYAEWYKIDRAEQAKRRIRSGQVRRGDYILSERVGPQNTSLGVFEGRVVGTNDMWAKVRRGDGKEATVSLQRADIVKPGRERFTPDRLARARQLREQRAAKVAPAKAEGRGDRITRLDALTQRSIAHTNAAYSKRVAAGGASPGRDEATRYRRTERLISARKEAGASQFQASRQPAPSPSLREQAAAARAADPRGQGLLFGPTRDYAPGRGTPDRVQIADTLRREARSRGSLRMAAMYRGYRTPRQERLYQDAMSEEYLDSLMRDARRIQQKRALARYDAQVAARRKGTGR